MRLLLASYYYPPSVGGLERQSHLLTRGLVERGHQVRVVSARLPGFPACEVLDGVFVQRVDPGRGSRPKRMATYLTGMLAVALRERAHTDVIQVQQALYPAAAMTVLARAIRRPLVVRNSGSGEFGAVREMRSLPLGTLALRLIGRLSVCVALSSEMAREMQLAGFRRMVRIPNAVAIPPATSRVEREAAQLALGLDRVVVLYCGRVAAEKGIDTLIAAWQLLGGAVPGTLVIVGDGPARDDLRRLAMNDPAIAGSVDFRGLVGDVQPYLRAADMFVLPSRSEGMSNALLEAMAAGLPVIASNVGGNQEVIETPDLGLLVPPSDPAALAHAIRELAEQPERAAHLGRSAREHVSTQYSASSMLTNYERLYSQLMRRQTT